MDDALWEELKLECEKLNRTSEARAEWEKMVLVAHELAHELARKPHPNSNPLKTFLFWRRV